MMLPPMGALIVGPCPKCNEFVMVFCGRVLPLQKEILIGGTPEEKQAHMMATLTEFLDERVQKVVEQITPESAQGFHQFGPEAGPASALEGDGPGAQPNAERGNPLISREELDRFVQVDLPQLDNPSYFRDTFK
jgi:hypothetical protein